MRTRLLALARPLAILAGAALIAVVMIKSRPQLEARSASEPPPRVEVQLVELGSIPVTVTAHGNVRAWRQLELTAEVTGRIRWQSPAFEPGVVIDAGEPLLRIERSDYELALAEARQALASAELGLADARSLRQAARIDEAEATVAAARARITRAERDLANTEISAPYDAVIDEQSAGLGQFVSAGAQLGRLLGAARAQVRLPVPPRDIGFVEAAGDAPVALYAAAGGGERRWDGRIVRIEARLDDQTRVFPVIVEVEQPLDTGRHGEPLRFGSFVRAEIAGSKLDEAVAIPQAALHGDDDVFLLEEDKLVRRPVKIARIADGAAFITGGLADGDRVVTTRLDLMFEGMQVALLDD